MKQITATVFPHYFKMRHLTKLNHQKLPLLSTAIIFSLVFFTWINSGASIADSSDSAQSLPPTVQSAVLEAASQQTSRTVASLKILEFQPQEWSDGCLGLTEPGRVCVQQVISGWQVKVTDGLRNWTFRTDEAGDIVKLEQPDEE